ncbi:class III poly(R)-hydroxyalkanoic acid synthase subunit PhaE [Thioalkalivibrio denitrificans]|uniref:Poly(3-hydroxyalkanoate) polymerase subunit PhaE n=1 Tax=Thioalkalivibrio denitrificans TaxID=108003 RepID=A0A1V3NCJ0_9GAMM|nr:class III poly(R)-hydroxyalkanoic acid synthase subunit PhaE [Thioalkalivibrio denitrificans]OOG22819.1 class III poly(R)-hydroxyalkanoic acid synthase subunit PhaE [Thioalkalivibrio denitrificans]
MSDSNPFNPDAWMEAQRKYWDAWLDLSRTSMEAAQAADPARTELPNPWAGALDQWWKSVSPAAPPDARDFYNRMMDLGRGYFTMAEGLMRQNGGKSGTDALKSWLDQCSDALRKVGMGAGQADDRTRDFMAFWQLPMDTWQRVASSFMPLPGDMLKALRPEGAAAFGPGEHLEHFLSLPGVGYTRESQEQYQSLARRVLEYQRAYQAYEAGLAKVALDSVERFRARLDDAARREKPITTMRELFNEWVDVCEEVYGEYSVSDEYARTYGELVNALMAVKKEGSRLVDEVLEGLNMPTRREISTLHQRFQESRREIRSLRRELDALKGDNGAAAEESPKPAKTAAPKSAPKRKAAAPAKKSGGSKAEASGKSTNKRS